MHEESTGDGRWLTPLPDTGEYVTAVTRSTDGFCGEVVTENHECCVAAEGDTMAKNPYAKTRPRGRPYETWTSRDGTWKWNVLKKWQVDDDKPYAKWFCDVVTPIMPEGEMGDVYVAEIKRHATRTFVDETV